jgi:hypothetical protein
MLPVYIPVTLASKAETTEWMLSCNTTVNCDNLCFSSLTAVHYCVTFSLANSPFSTYLSSNQSIFQFQKHYSNIASVNVLFQQVYWMNWSNFLKELLWWKSWLWGQEIILFPLVNVCLQEYLLHICINLGKRHGRWVKCYASIRTYYYLMFIILSVGSR